MISQRIGKENINFELQRLEKQGFVKVSKERVKGALHVILRKENQQITARFTDNGWMRIW